jgi:hypothetical protein
MAFRQYTKCFNFSPGNKPFNEKDLPAFLVGVAGGPLLIGAIASIVLGALATGIGVFVAVLFAILDASDKWLNHRLICLPGGDKCAVGRVKKGPEDGGVGNLDNDEFFNLALMPHPWYAFVDEDQEKAERNKVVAQFKNYPANEEQVDGFQGQELLAQDPILKKELGYGDGQETYELHCEAEGDFWVKMAEWAAALAFLVTLVLAAVLVATVAIIGAAGPAVGAAAAAGCAILAWLGPVGCFLGALLGALLALALAGAAEAAVLFIAYKALEAAVSAIFDANKGNVEDANVGDRSLGPIRSGDRVVVFGLHVYDGYHAGWNELHPLKAVAKLHPTEVENYLEWDPNFVLGATKRADGLTEDDIRHGLSKDAFRARVNVLKDAWCRGIRETFDETVRKRQQSPSHRWTAHPAVDGCQETIPVPR